MTRTDIKSLDGFEFRSDQTNHFGVTWLEWWKKWCLQLFSFTFDQLFVKLAGKEDRHKSLNELEFWPDRIIHFGVIRPWVRTLFPQLELRWAIAALLGCLFSVTMSSIFIKLTDDKNRHKFSDKFELQPDLINHFGVTCPWVVKKKNWCSIISSSNLLATRTGLKSQCTNFSWIQLMTSQLSALGAKNFLTGRFCYAETGFGFSVSSFNSTTVPPKVAWSFQLYLYLELTIPQVSDCCPLGDLFNLICLRLKLCFISQININ